MWGFIEKRAKMDLTTIKDKTKKKNTNKVLHVWNVGEILILRFNGNLVHIYGLWY